MAESVEIVLVEDDPDDAELTIRAFKKHRLANHIRWLKDGEEALNFLFEKDKNGVSVHKPKVILLDIKLPKIDGVEILRRIQQDGQAKEIPVVVLIGSDEEKRLIDCPDCRIDYYMQKPVDFPKFSDAVKEIGLSWLLQQENQEK
jgi:CheY-like chemotaxis protein